MTNEQLAALGIDSKWLKPLEDTFAKYDISTPVRQAAFIGQCSHESAGFRTLEENLNYKPESLMKVWPSRFPDLATAMKYAHNPEAIANKVYGGRMGNRDESSGDGFRFHGRGCIQLTGHDAYFHCGQALGVDLVANPDLVAQPQYAALSAGWFWNTHNCNALADAQDWTGLTKKINGGTFGLQERVFLIQKALSVLN